VEYHKVQPIGFLLFSLYVNDFPFHTKFDVNLFSDYTVFRELCFFGLKNKNIVHLQQQAIEELNNIDKWMKFNRLSINYPKTTYFITQPKRRRKLSHEFDNAFLDKNIIKYQGKV